MCFCLDRANKRSVMPCLDLDLVTLPFLDVPPINFWLKIQVPRHHVALKHLYGPNCPSGLPKHLLQYSRNYTAVCRMSIRTWFGMMSSAPILEHHPMTAIVPCDRR